MLKKAEAAKHIHLNVVTFKLTFTVKSSTYVVCKLSMKISQDLGS